jgi:proteasome accessory factor A
VVTQPDPPSQPDPRSAPGKPAPAATRRILGLETEFGLTWAGGALTPEEAARELFQDVVAWGRSSNVFLVNAARLYLDVGSHPEYATAECVTLTDLIAQDVAGQRILAQMAARTQQRLAGAGTPGALHLFKNNVDSVGNSFGCHENYSVRRSTQVPTLHRGLIPFLVARQVLTGAGHILTSPRGARYVYSQRADHVWESVSSATTRSRPMINTRDEALADGALYRRLHVIVGDSSMCQATTLLKAGSTDLVLRLIEAGAALPQMDLASPAHAIRSISHGSGNVALRDGREVSGTDIVEAYLDCVETYQADDAGPHPTDAAVLDLWRRAVGALRSGNLAQIERELDWAIKKRLIERYRERTGASLLDPRVARLELAYHDIGPDGLLQRLEESGAAVKVVTEEQVRAAIVQPPANTRAALRGRFIAAARTAGTDYSVDWVTLKLGEPHRASVDLLDPFATADGRVDALIAGLEAGGGDPAARNEEEEGDP